MFHLPALGAAFPAVIRKNPAIAVVGAGGAIGAVVLIRKKNAGAAKGASSGVQTVVQPAAMADTTATDLASAFQDMFNQLAGQVGDLQEQINTPNPGVNDGGLPIASPAPAPATPGTPVPVNWDVLSSLTQAGYSSEGIRMLDAANKAGVPAPPPSVANGNGGPLNVPVLTALAGAGLSPDQIRALDAANHAGLVH